jgi:hypothetical protein
MRVITMLDTETAIPLKMLWAAKAGLSRSTIADYSSQLLFDTPHIGTKTAIILGATRATAFVVKAAVEQGYEQFVVIGGKPVGREDKRFTSYIEPRIISAGLSLPPSPDMSEKDYGSFLLTNDFGIDPARIRTFDHDASTNMSDNMQVLRKEGYNDSKALEFYSLAGTARRAIMTARKVLDRVPVIVPHTAWPTGVTKENWANEPTARAHMAGEAAKNLVYARKGFCQEVDLAQERVTWNGFLTLWPG